MSSTSYLVLFFSVLFYFFIWFYYCLFFFIFPIHLYCNLQTSKHLRSILFICFDVILFHPRCLYYCIALLYFGCIISCLSLLFSLIFFSNLPIGPLQRTWNFVVVFVVCLVMKKQTMFVVKCHLNTLQGTNISPKNGILKMIFLFPRWDMLVPWRVFTICFVSHLSGSWTTELEHRS